jgi:hypothetical protein
MSDREGRWQRYAWPSLFVLAVVAHTVFLVVSGPTSIESYRHDANVYMDLARNLWRGGSYGSLVGNEYPPGYPIFIAPLFAISSNALRFHCIYAAHGLLFGVCSLALLPWLKDLCGRKSAFAALAAIQLLAGVTLHAQVPRSEPLLTALLLVAAGLSYNLAKRPSARRAFYLLAICGLIISTRRIGLAVLVGVAVLLTQVLIARGRDWPLLLGAALGLAVGLAPELLATLSHGEALKTYGGGGVRTHLGAISGSLGSWDTAILGFQIAARQWSYFCLSTMALPIVVATAGWGPLRKHLDQAHRFALDFILCTGIGLAGLTWMHIVRYWLYTDQKEGWHVYPRYLDPMEPLWVALGFALAVSLLGRADVGANWKTRLRPLWLWGSISLAAIVVSGDTWLFRGMRLPWYNAFKRLGLKAYTHEAFAVVALALLALLVVLWVSQTLQRRYILVLVVACTWFISGHHLQTWANKGFPHRTSHYLFHHKVMRAAPRAPVAVPVKGADRSYFTLAFRSDHDVEMIAPERIEEWARAHPDGFVVVRDKEFKPPLKRVVNGKRWTVYRTTPANP